MGYWLTIRGATVTGTVRAATKFLVFLCALYDVTPPTFEKNTTAVLSPFPYVTELAAATKYL